MDDIDTLEEEKASLEMRLEEEKRAREQDKRSLEDDQHTKVIDQQPDPRNTVISGQTDQSGYQLQLQFENGPLTGESKLINHGMTIGRAKDNLLVVVDKTVSGRHCKIDYTDNQYMLTDLGSTNGTIVNGNKINKCVLKQGDKISLGSVNITVR